MSGHNLAVDMLRSESTGEFSASITTEDPTGTLTSASQIPAEARFATITSGNANYVAVLPDPIAGHQCWLTVGSNGFELRTPANSGNTINTVDSDGTNELAVAANNVVMCLATSSTGWFVDSYTAAGADVDGNTPN